MKYGIWTKTAEQSDAWRAEQERIADEHRKAMSAAKTGNLNAAKNNTGTTSTSVELSPALERGAVLRPDAHKTRAAKAEQSKTDAGTVAKMDALITCSKRNDLKTVSRAVAVKRTLTDGAVTFN